MPQSGRKIGNLLKRHCKRVFFVRKLGAGETAVGELGMNNLPNFP